MKFTVIDSDSDVKLPAIGQWFRYKGNPKQIMMRVKVDGVTAGTGSMMHYVVLHGDFLGEVLPCCSPEFTELLEPLEGEIKLKVVAP